MLAFNLNNKSSSINEEEGEVEIPIPIPREHLFEKPLTPSDVGKLNRLVIPKQHAEKYFPLSGGGNNNNESGSEKGLLLNFEDESGKPWRFRYSYWNSSQSYVLTKGWSRFVKEKRLDAGDIVLFQRDHAHGRLFIGWKRRNTDTSPAPVPAAAHLYYGGHPYPGPSPPLPYQPHHYSLHAGRGAMQNHTEASVNNNTRRQVRLFGVNLECEVDESSWSEPTSTVDGGGSSTSSHHQGQGQGQDQANQHYYQYQFQYSKPHVPAAASSYSDNHTDMNFSRDVNQMSYYHQG